MPELTQSQIEQARKEKPCPRCGTVGHRARTDAGGGKWLMKCLRCRKQWTEDKEKGD